MATGILRGFEKCNTEYHAPVSLLIRITTTKNLAAETYRDVLISVTLFEVRYHPQSQVSGTFVIRDRVASMLSFSHWCAFDVK
jgi:hypothetical protein